MTTMSLTIPTLPQTLRKGSHLHVKVNLDFIFNVLCHSRSRSNILNTNSAYTFTSSRKCTDQFEDNVDIV